MSWLVEIPWLTVLSGIAGGLIVAIANHFFSAKRDSSKRLSDYRIQMLLGAWKKIEAASNIEDWTKRDKAKLYQDLEDAYASIILLGSDEQIQSAVNFAVSVSKGPDASSLELLILLRSSLRKELGLSESKENYAFLRMGR